MRVPRPYNLSWTVDNLSVRARLLLLWVALSLLFVSLALVWTYETEKGLTQLNERALRSKKRLVEQVILLQSEQLSSLVYDDGNWDGLVQFVQTRNQTWARNNLLTLLQREGVDGIWVYRRDLQPVLSKFRTQDDPLVLLPKHIAGIKPGTKAARWFQSQRGAVWEIYATTIHRGQDGGHTGEYFGYLVVSRRLNPQYIKSLQSLAQCQIGLYPVAASTPRETLQAFHTVLYDNVGKRVAILRVQLTNSLPQILQRSVLLAGLYFICFALLAALVLGYWLSRWIGEPIQLLAKALKERQTGPLTRLLAQKTEFGDLARLTLEFFQQEQGLREAHDELEERVADRTRALAHHAYHDALTGLPNRVLLREHLEKLMQSSLSASQGLAVLFVDIDNFKVINDSLGHEIGDQVLKKVGKRLKEALGEQYIVGRISGDEFVILLPNVRESKQAMAVVSQLQGVFEAPLRLPDRVLFVTLSMGVSLRTSDETAADLLRNADTAMYVVKSRGKAGVAVFDRRMKQRADRRLELEVGLRYALTEAPEELSVLYQPIYSLKTGKIHRMEALVRWRHPQHGDIYPTQFIQIAEEAGLIGALGSVVLAQAGVQVASWTRQFGHELGVGVNFSVRQLQDQDTVDSLFHTLRELGLAPHQLELELTETIMMQHPDLVADRLRRLRRGGVRIAMDDFGTGYSSIAVLAQLPLDVIKIDRSFVSKMENRSDIVAMVKAIIELGHALKLHTIAEGIETQSQCELLRELGCADGQGYYLSRPLTAGAMEALLREQFGASG